MRFTWLIICLISSFLCLSCTKEENANQSNNTNTKTLNNTINISLGSEPPSLDPTKIDDVVSSRITYDLFAGLVTFDQDNKVIPAIAKDWEMSKDKKTYTFHLRDDAKFSDGKSITAEDFVYAWRRLIDPKNGSSYSFLLNDVLNAVEIIDGKLTIDKLGAIAKDDHTFVVKLKYPNHNFVQILIMPNLYALPKHTIEKYGDEWTHPNHIVTSGAYAIKEHVINGYIIAKKNPYYYNHSAVAIDTVKYLPYEDSNTIISAYKTGDIDITFQDVPVDQYESLKREYPDQIHTVAREAISYYSLNMKHAIFKDNINLRKALCMSIDRDILVGKVLKQGQTPLYSLITDTIEGGKYKNLDYEWSNWPQKQKIDEAKRLYKLAGYGEGKPLKLTITYNTKDELQKVALAVASMWRETLGIDVSIQNQDWKTFLQTRKNADYIVARDGWSADYNDVDNYAPLYTCGSKLNNSHVCVNGVNQIFSRARAEQNTMTQVKLYKDGFRQVMNQYSTIPLYQNTYTVLINPRVSGYKPENNHLNDIKTEWFKLNQ